MLICCGHGGRHSDACHCEMSLSWSEGRGGEDGHRISDVSFTPAGSQMSDLAVQVQAATGS